MNIEKIKEIVNDNTQSNDYKKLLIVEVLAEDKSIIPMILSVLESERKQSFELISDMNLELSRCHLLVENPKTGKINNLKQFTLDKVKEFYLKYKDRIRHSFNFNFEK